MKIKTLHTLILLLLTSYLSPLFAQVNFEPLNKSVYGYLDNIAAQGYVVLNSEIKPFSRLYIAGKLKEIHENNTSMLRQAQHSASSVKNKLTEIEYDELMFYMRDFSNELEILKFDIDLIPAPKLSKYNLWNSVGFNEAGRFHLFDYKDSLFTFKLDPIFGYSNSSSDGENSTHFWNGLSLYGSISDFIGFNLNFRDNTMNGNNIDVTRVFSPLTGFTYIKRKNRGVEFDHVNANLTFSNSWASFTLGKDYIYYGEGTQSKVIIGNKAPSFPHIKLEINPVDWFQFSYVHGWLNSQVVDSSTIRYNESGAQSFKYIPKYFVTHLFSFTPFKSFNFSLGESIVYSDSFETIYLVPVMFFRLADHYNNVIGGAGAAGNAQLFGSFWFNASEINTRFYGSM